MNISADVSSGGPLFNHQADLAAFQMCSQIERDLGDLGRDLVVSELSQVLRHPTGNYQSHIQAVRHRGDTVINDDRVIYGAWLEGVESRNRTTRFKGYATFRRMTQVLQSNALLVYRRVSPEFLRRMG